MAKFNALVESWRPVMEERRGDVPIEFLLSWLAHESGGNACSTGFAGQQFPDGQFKFEAGIGQAFFQASTREALNSKTTFGGVTLAELRVGCNGQTLTRPLTADEKEPHVVAFLGEVNSQRAKTRDQLDAAGISWPEETEDFWMAVKLQHNLPCIPLSFFKPAAAAGKADSFAQFESFVNGLSRADYTKHTTAGRCAAGMAGFFGAGTANALAKAKKVGAGAGISILESFGGPIAVVALLLLASQLMGGALPTLA
jgi:hypothetical protein